MMADMRTLRTLLIAMLFVTGLSQSGVAQLTGPAPTQEQPKTTQSTEQKPKTKTTQPAIAASTEYADALQHLHSVGYWISSSMSPKQYANRQAVYAWQKVEGRKRTGYLAESDIAAAMAAQRPTAHDDMNRYHVEVDLDRQVLFTVDSLNRVAWIVPVSTGSGVYFETTDTATGQVHGRYALTPRGKFKVFYKVAGWKKSELGLLYYPMYVNGGIAIHGAQQVPPKPASHGCVRIPMFAAEVMYRAVPMGTSVLIFGENPQRHRDVAANGKDH
jgi:lipoprotein-anchoring transpeptidase ErfK/SrfK